MPVPPLCFGGVVKMKKKRQNRDKSEFEITIIKTEHRPGCINDIKHYYNYRKRLSNKDIERLKKNYKTEEWQMRINTPSIPLSYAF